MEIKLGITRIVLVKDSYIDRQKLHTFDIIFQPLYWEASKSGLFEEWLVKRECGWLHYICMGRVTVMV